MKMALGEEAREFVAIGAVRADDANVLFHDACTLKEKLHKRAHTFVALLVDMRGAIGLHLIKRLDVQEE